MIRFGTPPGLAGGVNEAFALSGLAGGSKTEAGSVPPNMGRTMNVMGQRQLARDSLLMIADVRLDGVEGDHQVRVRNLSTGGMMAVSDVPAAMGQVVQVALPRVGWVGGTVAWKQEDRFGIAFDEEIDAAAVRSPIKPGEWAQRRRQTADELAAAAAMAAAEQF